MNYTLPKNIKLVTASIEDLPDNQIRVTYNIGSVDTFSIVFPDKDKYMEMSEDMLIWSIFVQFSLVGPVPELLEDFARLVPAILPYLSENEDLYKAVSVLGNEAYDTLALEPCDCDHCKAFSSVKSNEDKSDLN